MQCAVIISIGKVRLGKIKYTICKTLNHKQRKLYIEIDLQVTYQKSECFYFYHITTLGYLLHTYIIKVNFKPMYYRNIQF